MRLPNFLNLHGKIKEERKLKGQEVTESEMRLLDDKSNNQIQTSLKNREIIRDYIIKYLEKKDQENITCIAKACNELDEFINIINDDSFKDMFKLYSNDIEELYEAISEPYPQLYNDLDIFFRLLERKGIDTNKYEILSVFAECVADRIAQLMSELLKDIDIYLDPMAKAFFMKFGEDVTIQKVIKEALRKSSDILKNPDLFDDLLIMTHFLDKFQFDYEVDELIKLIEQAKEEIKLEEFEKDLGTPLQKEKIEMEDFTELSGYEFKNYLKNLFELLGYTTIQTSLSGDQGSYLIFSKGDEKIVVQAKKYNGRVSNGAVQEVTDARNYSGANRAMIVTNSSFTKVAIELAHKNDIVLWDGQKLKEVIKELENKSAEDECFLQERHRRIIGGDWIQKFNIRCPCCEKEIDYEIDMEPYLKITEEGTLSGAGFTQDLDIKCPLCSFPFKFSFTLPSKLQHIWICNFCKKEFETKTASEEHERICGQRAESKRLGSDGRA
jgi:restriction system protein